MQTIAQIRKQYMDFDKVLVLNGKRFHVGFCLGDWDSGPLTTMEVNMVHDENGELLDDIAATVIKVLSLTEPEFINRFC